MRNLLTLIFLLAISTLSAQVSPTTTGFFVNLSLGGATVGYDEDDLDENGNGGGIDLQLGYGITPTTTLYANLGGYAIGGEEGTPFREDYPIGVFELGARFHFGQKVRPLIFYLDAGLQAISARPFDEPVEVTLNGAGLAIGPGLMLFLGDKIALDAQLRFSGGRINEFESGDLTIDVSDENFNYGFTRLKLGASFFL